MRIARVEDLHCDAGWRTWSFLKITTDDGVVGWSEYNESYGSRGLTAVIRKLAEPLVGVDPRPVERITAMLYAMTRQAPGGLIQQAIAAIENGLVDVKARALGVPVAALLCGPVRERLRLYWSHCGSYRLSHAAAMGRSPVRSLADVHALGQEVREKGFTALKTNIFCFDRGAAYMHQPGFARNDGWPELNVDRRILRIISDQMAAFREGAGAEIDLLLDLNFNFKAEAISRSHGRSSPIGSCGSRSTASTRTRWR
jgi:galactonate dehydratase